MMKDAVVFVGNLPLDIKEWELIDLFEKYGDIRHVDLKLPSRPPGFAFIQFSDPRHARAAVESRDGYDFYGSRIRVRHSSMTVDDTQQAPRFRWSSHMEAIGVALEDITEIRVPKCMASLRRQNTESSSLDCHDHAHGKTSKITCAKLEMSPMLTCLA